MKPVALRIDALPPMRVPLRFYLTAPVFGVLAGLLLLLGGEHLLASRWMPGALAMTHLLTLGVLAMVIVGSLFQVLPVLGGGSVPGARRTASIVHPLLTFGTGALSFGLLSQSSPWLTLGATALGLGLGGFAILVGTCVLRRRTGGDALFAIRLAALGMVATVALGVALALGIAWPSLGIPFRQWTDAHALVGFGGLTLLLVMGVSFQVVPMFHVAPAFDTRITRGTSLGVFLGVFLGVLGLALGGDVLDPRWPGTLLGLASAGYAIALLTRLHRRRRRRAEPLVRAWQLAAAVLLLSVVVGMALQLGFGAPRLEILLAVLFGYGFALTVVLAMLGKIAAFLAFTHLQRRCLRVPAAIPHLPTMEDLVAERAAWTQLAVHAAALVALCAAVLWPGLAPLAGATMIADFAVCGRNMLGAARRYRQADRAITEVVDLHDAAAPVLDEADTTPTDLPGDAAWWIFVTAEFLTLCLFFVGCAAAWRGDPEGFGAQQQLLDPVVGTLNAAVLVTSGYFAARAVLAIRAGRGRACATWLILATLLGVAFMGIKTAEYVDKYSAGLHLGSHDFWFFYFFLTGFHYLHVLVGLGLLLRAAWLSRSITSLTVPSASHLAEARTTVESSAIFWHMLDLVWVLLLSLLYLR